jgi:hypothetical protein
MIEVNREWLTGRYFRRQEKLRIACRQQPRRRRRHGSRSPCNLTGSGKPGARLVDGLEVDRSA